MKTNMMLEPAAKGSISGSAVSRKREREREAVLGLIISVSNTHLTLPTTPYV